jgi:ankyrin repeat protein
MPDAPNLEHLRKEAKRLLKECRSKDPEALQRISLRLWRFAAVPDDEFASQIKLADVHHALARERGYSSWRDLIGSRTPVKHFLAAIHSADLERTKGLVRTHPGLAKESLHAACAIGDVKAAAENLRRDPSLINKEENGLPPLFCASCSTLFTLSLRHAAGLLECAELLLDRGADPNAAILLDPSDPETQWPVVMTAIMGGNEAIGVLLQQRGANVKEALEMHANLGRKRQQTQRRAPAVPADEWPAPVQMTDELYEKLSELRKVSSAKHPEYRPAHKRYPNKNTPKEELMTFDPRDYLEAETGPVYLKSNNTGWQFLVEQGANPNGWFRPPENGAPLHVIVEKDLGVEIAETFVKHGADPNLRRKSDARTPYVLAVRCGNQPMADLLRAHGARLEDASPADELVGACRRNDEKAARSIVAAHPEMAQSLLSEDRETLFDAVRHNRIAEVRLMAESGFNFAWLGACGATALHLAAWQGLFEMSKLLLEFRAPLHMRDTTYGETPLDWALHGFKNSRNTGGDDDYKTTIETIEAAAKTN